MRLGAPLALSGRDAAMGRQAAAGLEAHARERGVEVEIIDHASDPARAAAAARDLAGRVDLLLGPYGSGATRAVAEALAGEEAVLWNHGGAAVPRPAGRVVDVLGPAAAYWRDLAAALAVVGADPHRVALLHGGTGFGREVICGARASLAAAGARPVLEHVVTAASDAPRAVALSESAGATTVVGAGRPDQELALARALSGRRLHVGLVMCGVARAAQVLGEALLGWFGPAQWLGTDPRLPAGAEYPAAQALAACLVAERAAALAGSTRPAALWDAARALRTRTLIGDFAVDGEGRQTAHAPLLVRWERGPGGLERRVLPVPRAPAAAP